MLKESKQLNSIIKILHHCRKNPLQCLRISPFVSRCSQYLSSYLRNVHRLPNQLIFLRKLFCEDKFLLIILDACRADLFEHVYTKYIYGKYFRVRAPAAITHEWFRIVFKDPVIKVLTKIKPITIYSCNPVINSKVRIRRFSVTDYIGKEYIIDLWELLWDESLQTVPPWALNRFIKENGLAERSIVWYIQPHYPWINYHELFKRLINVSKRLNMNYGELLKHCVMRNIITHKDVLRGYLFNLHLVLKYVRELIDYAKRWGFNKIVITSDHGEAFGEFSVYWHPGGSVAPQLIVVPWLEVS